jgi:hypothetical protein
MTALTRVTPDRPASRTVPLGGVFAALILAAAPASIAVLRYVLPYYSSAEAADIVRDVSAHPAAQQLVIWLGFFASLTLPAAALYAGRYLYQWSPRLTTVAEILLFPAYLCLGWLVAGDAILVYGIEHGLDPDLVVDMYGPALHPVATVALVVFVVGHVLGTVLLGVAALRTRAVPVWAGVALAISQPVHLVAFVVLVSPTVDFLGWALNALAFGVIGVAGLRRTQ